MESGQFYSVSASASESSNTFFEPNSFQHCQCRRGIFLKNLSFEELERLYDIQRRSKSKSRSRHDRRSSIVSPSPSSSSPPITVKFERGYFTKQYSFIELESEFDFHTGKRKSDLQFSSSSHHGSSRHSRTSSYTSSRGSSRHKKHKKHHSRRHRKHRKRRRRHSPSPSSSSSSGSSSGSSSDGSSEGGRHRKRRKKRIHSRQSSQSREYRPDSLPAFAIPPPNPIHAHPPALTHAPSPVLLTPVASPITLQGHVLPPATARERLPTDAWKNGPNLGNLSETEVNEWLNFSKPRWNLVRRRQVGFWASLKPDARRRYQNRKGVSCARRGHASQVKQSTSVRAAQSSVVSVKPSNFASSSTQIKSEKRHRQTSSRAQSINKSVSTVQYDDPYSIHMKSFLSRMRYINSFALASSMRSDPYLAHARKSIHFTERDGDAVALPSRYNIIDSLPSGNQPFANQASLSGGQGASLSPAQIVNGFFRSSTPKVDHNIPVLSASPTEHPKPSITPDSIVSSEPIHANRTSSSGFSDSIFSDELLFGAHSTVPH
eukprot:254136_1